MDEIDDFENLMDSNEIGDNMNDVDDLFGGSP